MTRTAEQMWKDMKKQKKSLSGRTAQDMINRPELIRELCRKLGEEEGYVVYPKDSWEYMGHSPIYDFADQIVGLISMDDINELDSLAELKEHILFIAGAVHDFHDIKPNKECEKLAEKLANAFLKYIPGAADIPGRHAILPPKELVKGVATYVVMHENETMELRREASLKWSGGKVNNIDYRDIPMSAKKLGTIDGIGADSYLDPYFFPYGGNLEASLKQSLCLTFEAWLRRN